MQIRRLIQGDRPLVISMPHVGTFLPPDIKQRMTKTGLKLPDTDWHVDRLYAFAEKMGVSLLTATHSRYVIDLNRPQDDGSLYPGQVKTGLCPLETFDGKNIYLPDEAPDAVEQVNRIAAYWLPFHETLEAELQRIKSTHGYAILYDAHSIRSQVPRLFDGVLPDLNIGTVNGRSCAPGMAAAVMKAADSVNHTAVLNGRFVGGHITRHYGRPSARIHALQMELACKNYMDETGYHYDELLAEKLQAVLANVINALLEWKGAAA